ncbi:hypothetical protein BH10PSE19_BH10PSE19_22570 [soil metagenome]
MDFSRLKERIIEYIKALNQLEKAIQQPENEFIRDSVQWQNQY